MKLQASLTNFNPNIVEMHPQMIDEIEDLKIIISGSSSFDINKNAGEPLTGRKYTFNLYALSEEEYNQTENNISKVDKIKERLVFGNYPELLHIPDIEDKIDYLNEMIARTPVRKYKE